MSRNEQSDKKKKKARIPCPRNEKGTALQRGEKPPVSSAYVTLKKQRLRGALGDGTQT